MKVDARLAAIAAIQNVIDKREVKMSVYEEKVREFQIAMSQPVDEKLDTDLLSFRMELLREEYAELSTAFVVLTKFRDGNPYEELMGNFIKELCDLQYVLSGLATTFGIDLTAAFLAVHESNMSKLGDDGKPMYREDGKVMKGPNYRLPDMTPFIPAEKE